MVGFPNTIASTWQQAGRAGRSQGASLAVVIAYDDPIDQYLMRHPEYFFAQRERRARSGESLRPRLPHRVRGVRTPAGARGRGALRRPRAPARSTPRRGRDPHVARRPPLLGGARLPRREGEPRTISDDTYSILDAKRENAASRTSTRSARSNSSIPRRSTSTRETPTSFASWIWSRRWRTWRRARSTTIRSPCSTHG